MPFVPVENVAEAEMRMLLDNQKIENTLWFQHDGEILAADLDELTDALQHWWDVSYAGLTTGLNFLREVFAADQTSSTGLVSTHDGEGANGDGSTTYLPNNVSIVASFRTAQRGRSFRGRNYIAGIPTDKTSDANHIQSSYASEIITAYNDLLGPDALVTGWTWGVASRFSGVDGDGKPIPREAGIFTPITATVVVDLVIDSQRRRLPGRGQ